MSKRTLMIEGDVALTVKSMIDEARTRWPALVGAIDEEVITILLTNGLMAEAKRG